MIESNHLRLHIIRPTLEYLGLWSKAAENLLLGTAAQESHMGRYLVQLRGPAKGVYQMEPDTEEDIWNNYLDYRSGPREVGDLVTDLTTAAVEPDFFKQEMVGNLYYATAMARVHYLRVPEPLPDANDIKGLSRYWKQHYNTHLGHGTEDQFLHNYRRFVK